MVQHRGGYPPREAELREHGEGLRVGRGVGGRGAGGDDVERVADDVGDDQADQRPAPERLGQPTALDPRQVFANAVHLIDGRPAGVQQAGDLLFLAQGDAIHRRRQRQLLNASHGRRPPDEHRRCVPVTIDRLRTPDGPGLEFSGPACAIGRDVSTVPGVNPNVVIPLHLR